MHDDNDMDKIITMIMIVKMTTKRKRGDIMLGMMMI